MGYLLALQLVCIVLQAQQKVSIGKIAELEFDAACFGHGSVLKGKANVAFRRLVEKLAR